MKGFLGLEYEYWHFGMVIAICVSVLRSHLEDHIHEMMVGTIAGKRRH